MRKTSLFIAAFAIVFVLIAGCALISTPKNTTHIVTLEWADGVTLDYVLPMEMPNPKDLTEITDNVGTMPIGHFCGAVGFIVGHEDTTQDWYVYVFQNDGRMLLALYLRHVEPDATYSEIFWIYEVPDVPKLCTADEQEQFLMGWCSI